MKRHILLLLVCTFVWNLRSQENSFFTHYSSEDGLSQNTVMNILQDRKGNMWFATWDGINKFNGYSFKVYKAGQGNTTSLTNNRVDHIYEDKYGFLWLQTYDNTAHRFNPGTESFEHITADGEGQSMKVGSIRVLPNGTVWLIGENGGAIRVLTDPGSLKVTTTYYSAKNGTFAAEFFHEVFVDSSGNEWMLTNNGLAMIPPDKSEPETFFSDPQNSNKYSDQSFYCYDENELEICFGSSKGRIWQYQKDDKRFKLLELPTSSRVSSIETISPDELFVATRADGLFTYRKSNQKTKQYTHLSNRELPQSLIISTYKDKYNLIWIDQEIPGCVVRFNPQTGTLKREQMKVEPGSADRSHPSFQILEDINGRTWVHPYGGGFSYFDRKKNELVPFYNEPGSKEWRFSNKNHSFFSDRQGNLWIGTHSKGLEKITFRPIQFHLTTPYLDMVESLGNEVRALLEDNEGNIWVSFKNGVIRLYDSNRKYLGFLTESGSVSMNGVPVKGVTYSLMQDDKNNIWIGTKGNGLIKAEKKDQQLNYRLKRYTYNVDDVYSLSNDNIYCTYQDRNNRIWVATFAGGLNYIDTDPQGNTVFINHRNDLKGYPIENCYKVRFVTSDKDGRIWVGTTTGAITFNEDFTDPSQIRFTHYARVPSDPASLSNNDVHWITNTSDNELYLATSGGGLNKLLAIDENGKARFKSYSVTDGLPSDVLLSMREDDKKNLWISSEHSIIRFTPSVEKFENYSNKSFTFRVRFNEAASTVTSSGYMLFGANNGIFRFNPDSISKSNYVPPITFSRLLVGNQEVEPGKSPLLPDGLDNTKKLRLSHNDNIIGIQYAALDYNNPENIQYAYMLEGFDKQWTFADKLRGANYTNLPKGNYTFKVMSTNSDGVWSSNIRKLDIEILPSFWETPLAYFLYIVSIMLIILVTVYILFTIYRLKHEVSIEQQISDIKLRFFTNISHELRTPLTLISGPVEYVLKNHDLSKETREQLLVVERNTNRMLRLVNQILDFRKIQNKKMKMKVQRINIIPFVKKIMENFESLAQEHRIDYIFESEKEELYLWIDEDKFEKIIFNLLSNAFKYTPNGKMITVFISEDENTVSVEVRDQGIGIAENKKNSIFIRFENLVDKNLFNQASTGIGLSLVKELVEMHNATIDLDSKLGEGSCFRVEFKKGKEHYDDTVEFILEDTDKPQLINEAGMIYPEPEAINLPDVGTDDEEGQSRKTMLLVEDNQELRAFLRNIFSKKFHVIEAENGMEGWSKAIKFVPGIIISDVMMPEKDGIEMTKELRANMVTSHIPIVLLTAKTAIESKLEGLEYGADDYITKPFSATYLEARVDNLLTQRSKLQELYRDKLMNPIQEEDQVQQPAMSPIDRRFMEKLAELMEKNMDNGDLVVDELVQELAVSRSVFFKKLKTLTGLAPIEFIKEMRIKRAAQLIETGEFNMTQISYMVGINDPRYFSKCFKQKYQMTPTEYRDKIFKK